jgi:hypothetical protein
MDELTQIGTRSRNPSGSLLIWCVLIAPRWKWHSTRRPTDWLIYFWPSHDSHLYLRGHVVSTFWLKFFSKSALIQRAEDGSPPNDKPCHYADKSPKINTHPLVLFIKIYSTDISAQKDANTLSICLIGFKHSPIHQSRHNFVCFRNYCTGGTQKETGVRALYQLDANCHVCSPRSPPVPHHDGLSVRFAGV